MRKGTSLKLQATARKIEANDADLSGSTFTNINLAGAAFKDVNLAGATVHDANLRGLRIENADLRNASIANFLGDGMTIDGVPVSDLLAAFRAAARRQA